MLIRKILVMGLVGYALSKAFARRERRPGGDSAARATPSGVRPAGPREMRDPPPDWDATDERADESFPASDPPGNY